MATRQEQAALIIKQQQQRLLILNHASKCPIKSGCKATQHCAFMKELWKHIAKCAVANCKEPHCCSSRWVLAHFHRCKDEKCEICAPVRRAMQKRLDQAPAEKRARLQAEIAGKKEELVSLVQEVLKMEEELLKLNS